MTPEEALSAGHDILDGVLLPHGFAFKVMSVGVGSGGPFASGAYVRDQRRLELHLRWSLGLVNYCLGIASITHDALVRVSGMAGRNRYPGFSDDPLDAFRHLRADLNAFGHVFLTGSDGEFATLIASAQRAESRQQRDPRRLP